MVEIYDCNATTESCQLNGIQLGLQCYCRIYPEKRV